MSAHTPGPWEAKHVGQCVRGNLYDVEAGGRILVDTVLEDDALLIAAAPELLEACKKFVRKCDSGEARSKRRYSQMVEAINKAEGRS